MPLILVVIFFVFLKLYFLSFVHAIFDLVHEVEAIHVNIIIFTYFHFIVPKSLHTKFDRKRSSGFCEKQVLILICKRLSPRSCMPSFKIIDFRFLRRRFLKVLTIYGRGGHLSHVTWTIYTSFGSPFPRRLHIKFGFDWKSGFREDLLKMVDGRTPARWEYYMLTV